MSSSLDSVPNYGLAASPRQGGQSRPPDPPRKAPTTGTAARGIAVVPVCPLPVRRLEGASGAPCADLGMPLPAAGAPTSRRDQGLTDGYRVGRSAVWTRWLTWLKSSSAFWSPAPACRAFWMVGSRRLIPP